jgi:hypothetical protein
MSKIKPPVKSDLSEYYQSYYDYLKTDDLLTELREQFLESLNALGKYREGDGGPAYAPGKWTVKEMLGHLIDCERIFQFRALSAARGEQAGLPAFDEDQYVRMAGSENRSLDDLLDEWTAVRHSYECLIESLDEAAWDRPVVANGREVNNRVLLYFVVAHARHHTRILRERYGK